MKQQTVLIADSSRDFLLSLAFVLQQKYHVLFCQNGIQAQQLLCSQSPDLLVLDLSLPDLDRLQLPDTLCSRPVVLATSFLHGTGSLRLPKQLDIRCLAYKPASPESLADKVRQLLDQEKTEAVQRQLLEIHLSALSLQKKHDGWDYLLVILPSFAKNPHQSFTKDLYPDTGRKFGRSGPAVDRAIRYALQRAWEQGDPSIWQHYFPGICQCPSNSEFIRRISEELLPTQE